MKTFEQFLSEGSIRHEVTKHIRIGGLGFVPGDVYYTNDKGKLDREDGPAYITRGGTKVWMHNGKTHRTDGPAVEFKNSREWSLFGKSINRHSGVVPDKDKWLLLKGSVSNNFEILNTLGMNKEMQEYVIKARPDLAGQIEKLDPSLAEKYHHEKELSHVDL